MKKQIFALIVAVSFLLSLLTGCTPNDIPSSQNPVTLSMWHVYGSQTQSPLNTAIEEFNNTVAKSTEAFFLNKTLFDTFRVQTGVTMEQLQNSQVFLILGTLVLVCCVVMSHKYVSPILKKIEQVKAKERGSDPSNIREIDDLFASLAARDTAYETRLEELEQEIQTAQANATQTQKAYETALRQLDLAQEALKHLTAAQPREIVLEEYEFFVCNLGTLTPMEYRVCELYLEGKSAKQIAKILGISKNTLKYHNKNIYSKLGISSRKQLLRFAALKQHQQSTKTK